MSEHTPGPWIVEETSDFNASHRVMDVQEVTVALTYQQPHDTWTSEANANLIAASPSLLEACKNALGWYNESPVNEIDAVEDAIGCRFPYKPLMEAIAKAEGR